VKDIRKKKLESSLVREMAMAIQRASARRDGIGLVSVTRVELRPDFSEAVFFVSPFGTEKENNETMRNLKHLAGPLQSQIARDLHLRVTPRFRFEIDMSIKEGDRILDLIDRPAKPEEE
jgi:ribosome-binding factor A